MLEAYHRLYRVLIFQFLFLLITLKSIQPAPYKQIPLSFYTEIHTHYMHTISLEIIPSVEHIMALVLREGVSFYSSAYLSI